MCERRVNVNVDQDIKSPEKTSILIEGKGRLGLSKGGFETLLSAEDSKHALTFGIGYYTAIGLFNGVLGVIRLPYCGGVVQVEELQHNGDFQKLVIRSRCRLIMFKYRLYAIIKL